jgi:hypothetical protein
MEKGDRSSLYYMKRFGIIAIALGALLLTPVGAFARDKHHHHHHDWSYRGYDKWDHRDYRDYRDDRDRDNRDYWENQRRIEADRVANGYYPDGTPRYHYYRYR